MKTLIIGAGIAGVQAARFFSERGDDVTVIDKARGPSGRLASKRSDFGNMDHGAPLFRINDPSFAPIVKEWEEKELIAEWNPRWAQTALAEILAQEQWYVAVPRMSALCRSLLGDIPLKPQWRAAQIQREGYAWLITSEKGETLNADRIIFASPAPQTEELLPVEAQSMKDEIAAVEFASTWAAYVVLKNDLDLDWDIYRSKEGPIHTIIRESTKPQRSAQERLIIHATDNWSDACIDKEFDEILPVLMTEAEKVLGFSFEEEQIELAKAHRWRFAHARKALGKTHLYDADLKIGIIGDWCLGAGVGAAVGSAMGLAGEIN